MSDLIFVCFVQCLGLVLYDFRSINVCCCGAINGLPGYMSTKHSSISSVRIDPLLGSKSRGFHVQKALNVHHKH